MKKVMSLPTGLTQQGQRISGSKYFNKQIICMTTSEIAKRLYELCSSKLLAQAQMELYSDDSVSIEPSNAQWGLMTVKGKKAVMQKGRDFMTLVTEWNGAFTGQPIIYGSFIFMEMRMDLTVTGLGKINISEMGKFEVKDGKIISEEFYY